MACGGDHSMALTESGTVITWGCNGYGQLGTGNTTNSPNPIKITVDCGRYSFDLHIVQRFIFYVSRIRVLMSFAV